MLTVCIDQRGGCVRSGCAGDAGSIVKHARRGTRASLVDPKGRVLKLLGRRPPPLAMPPASPRGAILAQDLENTVQTISITRIDSYGSRRARNVAVSLWKRH